MKDSPGKILEVKKKILSHVRNRENSLALKLFHKHYSEESPPDPQFVIKVYTELNKVDHIELGFRFMEETSSWLPEEAELQDLRTSSLKIYFDRLLVQGNQLLSEREDKANKFHDSLKRTDSMSKDKVQGENEKILLNITNKAKEAFRKAYEINPDSIGPISGIYRCYSILQDHENMAHFQKILEEKNPLLYGKKEKEKEKESFSAQEFDIEEFNFKEVESLFIRKKFEEVIQRVDFLHLTHRMSVPLLIFKAKSLVSLKRFKETDKVIFEAEKLGMDAKKIQELKNQVHEDKYALLSKAGSIYLNKALELGPSLGMSHFNKARICLRKALEIFPDNIELLDQQYTVLRYLNEEEQAFKTKAMIYLLNNRFVPSFDKEGTSSLCFIATFAYAESPEKIADFRWFRREFLLTSNMGKQINCMYVKHSAKLVRKAKKNAIPTEIFRFFLFPIWSFVKFLKLLFKFEGR